jgi:ribosomal protein L37AE/L43A
MEKYPKERIEEVVKEKYSIAECLRALGLRPAGGNYKWFNKIIKKFAIDTSHFTGQGWSLGKNVAAHNRKYSLEEILIQDSPFCSSNALKLRLHREGVKNWICEKCNNTEWNGQKIPLELEHCNGDNTDNRIENLQFLCPNCHAQTPFYRGRNKLSILNERREMNRVKFGETLTGNPELSCDPEKITKSVETLRREPKVCQCGSRMSNNASQCRECEKLNRKTNRPNYNQLIQDFEELKSFVQVGKKYGVVDNTVRKWLKFYQIDEAMVKRKSSAQTI